MTQKMLINAQDPEDIRVAVVEDGHLEAFYVETKASRQTRGNIYKGVVVNIEPSLGAAFIDYGQPRHGFLQFGDIEPGLWPDSDQSQDLSVKEILRRGQELLVQVVKEPIGGKGSSLTTYLSVPGQALVLTMGRHLAGVSRKLEDEAERKRLKAILAELKLPANLGIIARTAAAGRSKRELTASAKLLLRLFQEILKKSETAAPRSLINCEEELAVRTVRDLFTNDVDEILVDNQEVLENIRTFITLVNPKRVSALRLYREQRPIFAKYDIEKQLEDIYSPRVNLPGGGSLIIHSTEALVSVDVNSGKALKGKELEETALAVNLEAAEEIARQLRLRDLGGLVVIDFIDMRDNKAKTEVQKALKEALKKDKAKTDLGRLSRFGLLELSRQRIRPSIDHGDIMTCPHCQGRGLVRTTEAAARLVLRGLGRQLGQKDVRLAVSPEIAHYLQNQRRAKLASLEEEHHIHLEVIADSRLGAGQWQVESSPPLRGEDNNIESTAEQSKISPRQSYKENRPSGRAARKPPLNNERNAKTQTAAPKFDNAEKTEKKKDAERLPEKIKNTDPVEKEAIQNQKGEGKETASPPAKRKQHAAPPRTQLKAGSDREGEEKGNSVPNIKSSERKRRHSAAKKQAEPVNSSSPPVSGPALAEPAGGEKGDTDPGPGKRSRRSGSARRRARKQKLATITQADNIRENEDNKG
ncbi:MAG: Rne/Rng family ribonuclease [Desulfarculales bacterium]|jgi:ribonuclease E|nr:Rne/Rng family ribonuclease [Desulfarculales bacterium]